MKDNNNVNYFLLGFAVATIIWTLSWSYTMRVVDDSHKQEIEYITQIKNNNDK